MIAEQFAGQLFQIDAIRAGRFPVVGTEQPLSLRTGRKAAEFTYRMVSKPSASAATDTYSTVSRTFWTGQASCPGRRWIRISIRSAAIRSG